MAVGRAHATRHREGLAIVLVVTALVLVFLASRITPRCFGDGREYALVLEALCAHGSPDIRVGDVKRLEALVAAHPSEGYRPATLRHIRTALEQGDSRCHQLIRTPSGTYVGLHFWFYPLVSCPARLLLSLFRGNELQAFQLTNAVLTTLFLACILLFSTLGVESRLFLAFLYVFSGNMFYFRWGHPEIYTAGLAFLASVAFIHRRYPMAALSAALGALQNPPLALLIPAVIAVTLYNHCRRHGRRVVIAIDRARVHAVVFCVSVALCLVPIGYNLLVLGTPSPIFNSASTALSNVSFAPLERIGSFFLDLNQGMVVGMPAVMALTLSLLFRRILIAVRGLRSTVPWQSATLVQHHDLLLAWMISMAVATLVQANWNAGQAVFMRYALWAGMPLVAWTVIESRSLGSIVRPLLLGTTLILQVVCTFSHGGVYALTDTFALSPVARFVFNRFPQLYNPIPEIFTERVLHRAEGRVDLPVAFRGDDGYYKKILLTAEHIRPRRQGRAPRRILVDGRNSRPLDLSEVDLREKQWRYLAGDFEFVSIDRAPNMRQIAVPIEAVLDGTRGSRRPGHKRDGGLSLRKAKATDPESRR